MGTSSRLRSARSMTAGRDAVQEPGRNLSRAARSCCSAGGDQRWAMRPGAVGHGTVLLSAQPADFLDTSFFDEVERKFHGCSGKACKFTQAYIIAREAGASRPEPARHSRQGDAGAAIRRAARHGRQTAIQVRVDLQADRFAGVLGESRTPAAGTSSSRAMSMRLCRPASAIGDDALQRKSGGRVVPDSFTHADFGAAQAVVHEQASIRGKVSACNTFSASATLIRTLIWLCGSRPRKAHVDF